jgi:DNA-binding response OmpR family regulator
MGQSQPLSARVLVLEPEALCARHLVQALQALHLPMQVTQASTDDLAWPPNRLVHLVMLGLGHDGPDNLQQLRQVQEKYPRAVIMGVCPRVSYTERCALLDAGLDFILEKPFFVDECVSSLRALLRLHPLLEAGTDSLRG